MPELRLPQDAEDIGLVLLRVHGAAQHVAPGGTARLSIDFAAPAVPGRYELSLDLVEEGKAWFSDWGFPPVTLLLQVD